ncbi:MAG: Dabb family protein [Bacteroidota bacterium]
MRKITSFIPALLLILLTLNSCNQHRNKKAADSIAKISAEVAKVKTVTPGFVHAVYFWLKDDNPELVDDFINNGLPQLAKVPSIQSVSWGPPAGTPREVVDNSYDMAWIVNFASSEDQDAYQVDSLHVVFVEKYKSIFERVQVYDNIVNHHERK